jgi:hypothetical protein
MWLAERKFLSSMCAVFEVVGARGCSCGVENNVFLVFALILRKLPLSLLVSNDNN